jgi:hypothetical protein
MKVQQSFTFIVSRNFGHPITWNVQAWRVYVGGLAALAFVFVMTVLSSLYLLSFPHVREVERERQELELERDALREELHALSQAAFDGKDQAVARAAAPALEESAANAAADSDLYIPPFRIDNFSAQVTRGSLEAAFRIVSQGDFSKAGGGFLFAIFEDQAQSPPRFAASPPVDVNEEGFPLLYKAGIRFSRVRNAQTYHRGISKHAQDETFTHVTVYLFSLRGGLLAKERYPLDPRLFTASL